jgi:hypothetical protein
VAGGGSKDAFKRGLSPEARTFSSASTILIVNSKSGVVAL